jgi:tetratricopeptide (TPR) repeat protein
MRHRSASATRRKRDFVGRLGAGFLLLVLVCATASAQAPGRDASELERIRQIVEQGRAEEAERPLLAYAVSHPRDARALELLARLRQRQGRLEEAEALYRRVLALDATLIEAKVNLGGVLLAQGRAKEGRLLLDEAAASAPTDARVVLGLARALLLAGDYARSRALVQRLPPAVRNAEALPLLAASSLGLGEPQKITALLPAMRRASARSPLLAVECAEVLRRAGMRAQAANLLKLALASVPRDAGVLLALGQLETEAREFAAARRYLEEAAVLAPESAEIFVALVALEEAQGNASAALAAAEKARALAPDSQRILALYVVSAMRAERPHEAAGAAAALLSLNPDEPEFVYLSGASSLQAGNLAAAEKALVRYKELRPMDARGCFALGMVRARQRGQEDAARSEFERCLRLDASSVEVRYQLGLVLKSQGETARATQLLEEATSAAPRHAEALRDLGALYLQAGEDGKARAALERAVALKPEDAETHFQLSRLYGRAGQTEQARRHRETFQRLKSRQEQGGMP